MIRPLLAFALGSAALGGVTLPSMAQAQSASKGGGSSRTEERRIEREKREREVRERRDTTEIHVVRRNELSADWREYDRELGRLQRELSALQMAQGNVVNAAARRVIDSAVRRLQPEMLRAERALILAQERQQLRERATAERSTAQAVRQSQTQQQELRGEMAPMLRRLSTGLIGVQQQLPVLTQRQPRGWIGITMTGASEMRLTSEGRVLRHTEYPVVESVEPGSPAEEAGVEAGDTIIAFNGRDVRAHDVALDRMLDVNATMRMTIRRGRKTRSVVMKVERRPEQRSAYFYADSVNAPRMVYVTPRPSPTAVAFGNAAGGGYAPISAMAPAPPAPPGAVPAPTAPLPALGTGGYAGPTPRGAPMAAGVVSMVPQPPGAVAFGFGYGTATFAGASVLVMDDDLRSTLDVDGGLLIVRVAPGTPAAEAGLRSGDVLRSVDGSRISAPGMFQRALERANDREVKLVIVRRKKEQSMVMRW